MIIKQPEEDIALEGLLESLKSIFDKIRSTKLIGCMENIFTILYFSSYVIAPEALRLSHPRNRNITMLGLIEDMIRGNKERVVCVVRTSAPSIFPPKKKNYGRRSNKPFALSLGLVAT